MYGVSFPMSEEAMSDNFILPIGKCKVEREGSDVTIVAHSLMVTRSLDAADELAKEGIKAEVINLRSIRPLDIDTIKKSIQKTNRYVLRTPLTDIQLINACLSLVIVEGGFPAFGVGSEICAQVIESEAFDYLDAPVERVTGADVPTPVRVCPVERCPIVDIAFSTLSTWRPVLSQMAPSSRRLPNVLCTGQTKGPPTLNVAVALGCTYEEGHRFKYFRLGLSRACYHLGSILLL